jgi:hypothetical protein
MARDSFLCFPDHVPEVVPSHSSLQIRTWPTVGVIRGAAYRSPGPTRPRIATSTTRLPGILAGRRTFSLTFAVTQRDAICRRSLSPAVVSVRRDRCRRANGWIKSAEPVRDQSPLSALPWPSPCPSWWWYSRDPAASAITLAAGSRLLGCTGGTVPRSWPLGCRDGR